MISEYLRLQRNQLLILASGQKHEYSVACVRLVKEWESVDRGRKWTKSRRQICGQELYEKKRICTCSHELVVPARYPHEDGFIY